MFKIFRKELDWNGTPLVLETGKVARQADGAVMVSLGETTVLCTAVAAHSPKPGQDFFPLTVNYQEKAFAAGKIPGGFFKREGRPSENETLVSRLIDRPIRPLFPSSFKCETQVICTVLAHDMENNPDIAAMIGASAALCLSGVPFFGPIAGARVGWIDGEYVLNPTVAQMDETALDLVLAGTHEGVLMVESEAQELSEEVMLGAVTFGHDAMKPVIDAIIDLAESCAKEPRALPEEPAEAGEIKAVIDGFSDQFVAAYQIADKTERQAALGEVRAAAKEKLGEDYDGVLVGSLIKAKEADVVRGSILETGQRIDGRDTKTVRQIVAEAGFLPRAHGSSLFTRGETQAMVVATLGTGQDEQIIDALVGESRSNFMLHYNFPPYSVGEAGRVGSPGRREIGHGKLAWRALRPLLPKKEDFPYTIRLVSEITESNGSSSMATVCGGSLALMDAGVPLDRPVAGIAMGLIKEGDEVRILTDIQGIEDFLGDMDFKVAGSEKGITALQMDMKITGLSVKTVAEAVNQARPARLHILEKMLEAIDTPRDNLSPHAPRLLSFRIDPELIGTVIGPGGRTIKGITERTNTKIDIEDGGIVTIASHDGAAAEEAQKIIEGLTRKVNEGEVFSGSITRIIPIGAFVEILPGKEGMIHISQLSEARVEKVEDVVKVGDEVTVRVREIDNRGRINLTLRGVPQAGDASEVEPQPTPVAPLS